jgi:hypothetical protein
MLINSGALEEGEGLHALDPDLPSLAIEAAIDLENIRLKRGETFDAISRLARLLKHSTQPANSNSEYVSSLDAGTITVLNEAVAGWTHSGKSLRSVKDLLGKAQVMANMLSRENLGREPQDLERARDFCVALARASAAYYSAIMDPGPVHPFRRE